jgi:hypothetical protein
MFFLTAI